MAFGIKPKGWEYGLEDNNGSTHLYDLINPRDTEKQYTKTTKENVGLIGSKFKMDKYIKISIEKMENITLDKP